MPAQPAPQYITDDKGNRVSVVLPVDQYQELLDDLEDLAAVAECKGEDTLSHDEVIKQLKDSASYEPIRSTLEAFSPEGITETTRSNSQSSGSVG
ncbi:hypothetical protein [Endozoicomonas sp. ONNA2]|uniref:hypothetical protein n=1 Tax=Endozoicomonas sp. ONNA2 TaxID=2828741 RepID=UPI002148FC8C|nr:hypothetical protein [Endozoicomonas sp. ONNA2]